MAMLRPSIHLLCLNTICWLALSPVYTIQPVVKPVVKPVWQPVVSCIQTFNRLSNPFDNRNDNRLYRVYSRLSNRLSNWFDNRFDNRMYRVNGVLGLTLILIMRRLFLRRLVDFFLLQSTNFSSTSRLVAYIALFQSPVFQRTVVASIEVAIFLIWGCPIVLCHVSSRNWV